MKKLLILFFVAITSFSVVGFSVEGSQKYVQISNQKQTESDKIIIYEFFYNVKFHKQKLFILIFKWFGSMSTIKCTLSIEDLFITE